MAVFCGALFAAFSLFGQTDSTDVREAVQTNDTDGQQYMHSHQDQFGKNQGCIDDKGRSDSRGGGQQCGRDFRSVNKSFTNHIN